MTEQQPERLAVVAPSFQLAADYARGAGLGPDGWWHVSGTRAVFGRAPGEYVAVTRPGAAFTGDQLAAWDYMVRRGWRHR